MQEIEWDECPELQGYDQQVDSFKSINAHMQVHLNVKEFEQTT